MFNIVKKLLVFLLLINLILSFNSMSALAAPTPAPASPHDRRVNYFPSIGNNIYHVCDNNGKLVRFIEFKDVSYELTDKLGEFKITINSEFAKDEYMELIIVDENEIIAYNNNVKVPVDKFGKYNVVHIIESGIIKIN